ncbi:endonuclease VII domain-containing protein [Streptosporangium saharense]|uniref:endonuclease VII domain-containing protein n=1 Tax=Streptosporangium saharense TaxID=1706840 RepID=UPI00160FC307
MRCTFDGCDNWQTKDGLCLAHYSQARRGKPLTPLSLNVTRRGIPPRTYKVLLEAQGGGCAICGKTPKENGRALSVDHDHSCCPELLGSCGNCVRALLCSRCNSGIGFFDDNHELILKAAAYLQGHQHKGVRDQVASDC